MHINTGHHHTFPESKSGVHLRLAVPKLGGSAQTQRERPNSNLESGFHLHKNHCWRKERTISTTASDDAPMRDPLCEGVLSERTSHFRFVSISLFVPGSTELRRGCTRFQISCLFCFKNIGSRAKKKSPFEFKNDWKRPRCKTLQIYPNLNISSYMVLNTNTPTSL